MSHISDNLTEIRELMAERRSIYNQVNELTTRIKQQMS